MDDSKKFIQQQFGPNAAKYATSQVHAHGASLGRLLELGQPQAAWEVLDASTGAGHTALAFAPLVARLIAVDLTPQMLTTARELASERGLAKIEFSVADVHALPFQAESFDLVANRLALHHYAEARMAISEMARVLKSGGAIAFSDNTVPPDKLTAGHINHWEKLRDRSHNWAYPAARLEGMFADAGLPVEHTESLSKELEFEPWADRMGASQALKEELRRWLDRAPESVRDWLMPRQDGSRLFFTLHEAIIIATKPQ